MSNPVIDQVKAFADFEENDIGEMPDEELRTHAAQAALKVLAGNWETAMGDGETLGKMLPTDIDCVVEALLEIKATLVNGLGDRLDEVHARGAAPGR